MYYPKKGGSSIILYDSYECHLPPVPDKSQILFHNLPQKDQFWRRQPLPTNYKERVKEEQAIRAEEKKKVDNGDKEKVTHVDPILERYRRQEFYRRKYGVWFYNNGVPTFLTGHNYWYLQWTRFDHKRNDGYPLYYEYTRLAYYFRQYAEEDPRSLGYIIIGARGSGKSGEELAALTNNMLIRHDATAALQSKNYEKDAKGVLFKSKLVPLFNSLPDFFKPVNSHGSNPETSFSFNRPSIKGKGAADVEYGPDLELNSYIMPVLPGEMALDSDTVAEIFEDEVGKCSPTIADIYERHKVNLRVVFRNHQKVGLMRKTSTVEKMTEGGAECLKLWKESDPKSRDKNGQTVSKIYRYFISALDTDTSPECCDIYGHVDRVKANQKIENALELIKHDYIGMSSEMRKQPRNESEAFIPDQSRSLFNIQKLTARIHQIQSMPINEKPYRRGNLYWLKEPFGPVWWERDDHAGRWNFSWFPDEYSQIKNPDQAKILNNVDISLGYTRRGKRMNMVTPKNDHLFRIGADPIKYRFTKDPRASKQAMHGFRLFDPHVDLGKPRSQWKSHNFIFEYINRPDDPRTASEDAAMSCIFLGCKMMPENNIDSLNEYFEDNGLENLMYYPKNELADGINIQKNSENAGLHSDNEVIDTYTRRLITFINQDCERMPFDETLDDWMRFDSLNPTPSHATVSSGFTLIHTDKKGEIEKESEGTVDDWFQRFDNSGMNSRFEEDSISIPK